MSSYTSAIKTILEVGGVLSNTKLGDDLIHGIRYHARHTFKIDFPRDEREIIESILWWENRFIDINKKEKLTDKDKKEIRKCYAIIEKRINELKAHDRLRNKTNTKMYNQLYSELANIKQKIEKRGIKIM